METKQAIVARTDIGMGRGKLAAQVARKVVASVKLPSDAASPEHAMQLVRDREQAEFDAVDAAVQEDLANENEEWDNYDAEEAGVKFEIADAILYDLIGELVSELGFTPS